ncbi:hypothetical protein HN992_03185 [Candidatus Woesearchaeota archaeon]|jgi:hypothetical protein|nr:hypothetical protein [Candidatus Woesearchaeota archaeon]MBT3438939.1 hypothetical protein [Candidatus Woesearchaeota archaeon]MBT4057970.1 hypothetical protein [Candidatus Woesearchaeota archaeon]MBT4206860.1 hypothetical protein [Candidatus Woesearchaeota archaeon]MBT4733349.1 hypothetical protein [Candidatus Woesearchaeota archaeon]
MISNKKGIGYVDWIISMGLFILVVSMTFIYLKPGVTPEFESKDLIELVESNFLKEYTWSSISIPIAVHNLSSSNITITGGTNNQWNISSYYLNYSSLILHPNFTTNNVILKCKSPGGNCNTLLHNGINQGIYLIYLKKDGATINTFNLSYTCNPPPSTSPDCNFTVGSKEMFTGWNKGDINSITEPYQTKKDDWSFPESRDFSIKFNGEDILAPNYKPSEQTNIYIKELLIQTLEGDGLRSSANTTISVW